MSISPVDDRYRDKVNELTPIVSEYGLQKKRIYIELAYLKKLSKEKIIPKLTASQIASMDRIVQQFSEMEFKKLKTIEKTINHDVKAVEYYLGERFEKNGLRKLIPYIHIGLTSEDINNLAYSLMLSEVTTTICIPLLKSVVSEFKTLSASTKHIPMLGRTHGQPAVPTTFGKEMAVYYYRLQKQLARLISHVFEGKLNGAVGNYNALQFVFPKSDWISIGSSFIRSLGLRPNLVTTQILPADNMIEFFQILSLVNGIIIDAAINIWEYIMVEICTQKIGKHQVGSSTMPQKINPILFENAEGILQLANSQLEFYARKLCSSRLQRDLSDSTVKRTFGTAIAYTVIGWKNMLTGLKKIGVNKEIARNELQKHWEVLGEAIQTYLRTTGDSRAYEKLKQLTQGKIMTKEIYYVVLKRLGLENKKEFINLTPEKYIGLAEKL